jgi:phage FluMu protein gp41
MSEIKETGFLPIGVEVAGVVHREFTLRPRLVRDSVDSFEECVQANDAYRGVALTARQIDRLGTLPIEAINTNLLLNMYDADLAEIMAAAGRLESRLLTFRDAPAGQPQAASGVGEDRSAVD